ncbi:MAG: Holliday junction resolvase RuvX [Candidatus Krumholzibacteriia bacterium]
MPVHLAFDYGLRRIGLAASDEGGTLALALETHVEGRDGSVVARVRELIALRGVETLVVGLPLTADGREGDLAAAARRFAGILERETGLPVILWDERYSSAEADRWLKGTRTGTREDRDAVAAAIILQSYLDSLAAGDRS